MLAALFFVYLIALGGSVNGAAIQGRRSFGDEKAIKENVFDGFYFAGENPLDRKKTSSDPEAGKVPAHMKDVTNLLQSYKSIAEKPMNEDLETSKLKDARTRRDISMMETVFNVKHPDKYLDEKEMKNYEKEQKMKDSDAAKEMKGNLIESVLEEVTKKMYPNERYVGERKAALEMLKKLPRQEQFHNAITWGVILNENTPDEHKAFHDRHRRSVDKPENKKSPHKKPAVIIEPFIGKEQETVFKAESILEASRRSPKSHDGENPNLIYDQKFKTHPQITDTFAPSLQKQREYEKKKQKRLHQAMEMNKQKLQYPTTPEKSKIEELRERIKSLKEKIRNNPENKEQLIKNLSIYETYLTDLEKNQAFISKYHHNIDGFRDEVEKERRERKRRSPQERITVFDDDVDIVAMVSESRRERRAIKETNNLKSKTAKVKENEEKIANEKEGIHQAQTSEQNVKAEKYSMTFEDEAKAKRFRRYLEKEDDLQEENDKLDDNDNDDGDDDITDNGDRNDDESDDEEYREKKTKSKKQRKYSRKGKRKGWKNRRKSHRNYKKHGKKKNGKVKVVLMDALYNSDENERYDSRMPNEHGRLYNNGIKNKNGRVRGGHDNGMPRKYMEGSDPMLYENGPYDSRMPSESRTFHEGIQKEHGKIQNKMNNEHGRLQRMDNEHGGYGNGMIHKQQRNYEDQENMRVDHEKNGNKFFREQRNLKMLANGERQMRDEEEIQDGHEKDTGGNLREHGREMRRLKLKNTRKLVEFLDEFDQKYKAKLYDLIGIFKKEQGHGFHDQENDIDQMYFGFDESFAADTIKLMKRWIKIHHNKNANVFDAETDNELKRLLAKFDPDFQNAILLILGAWKHSHKSRAGLFKEEWNEDFQRDDKEWDRGSHKHKKNLYKGYHEPLDKRGKDWNKGYHETLDKHEQNWKKASHKPHTEWEKDFQKPAVKIDDGKNTLDKSINILVHEIGFDNSIELIGLLETWKSSLTHFTYPKFIEGKPFIKKLKYFNSLFKDELLQLLKKWNHDHVHKNTKMTSNTLQTEMAKASLEEILRDFNPSVANDLIKFVRDWKQNTHHKKQIKDTMYDNLDTTEIELVEFFFTVNSNFVKELTNIISEHHKKSDFKKTVEHFFLNDRSDWRGMVQLLEPGLSEKIIDLLREWTFKPIDKNIHEISDIYMESVWKPLDRKFLKIMLKILTKWKNSLQTFGNAQGNFFEEENKSLQEQRDEILERERIKDQVKATYDRLFGSEEKSPFHKPNGDIIKEKKIKMKIAAIHNYLFGDKEKSQHPVVQKYDGVNENNGEMKRLYPPYINPIHNTNRGTSVHSLQHDKGTGFRNRLHTTYAPVPLKKHHQAAFEHDGHFHADSTKRLHDQSNNFIDLYQYNMDDDAEKFEIRDTNSHYGMENAKTEEHIDQHDGFTPNGKPMMKTRPDKIILGSAQNLKKKPKKLIHYPPTLEDAKVANTNWFVAEDDNGNGKSTTESGRQKRTVETPNASGTRVVYFN